MSNVIRMPGKPPGEIRRDCIFRNRSVQITGESGEKELYPCIVLYEEATDIPICYTGLERYLCHLAKSQLLDGKTLEARAYAVCHFLNYLLWETDIRSLHECSLDTIRDFLKSSRRKQDGEEYNKDTWLRYRDHLTDFLVLYHEYNQDSLPFRYTGTELRTAIVLRDGQSHRKVAMVYPASLHLKAPRTTHKKNRILVDGYLDLLLYEAKKYEPDIALGIALGAYAGLREGEVVNVSFGAVRTICRGFGIVSGVEIDLTDDAPFFKGWDGRTDPGSIKKYRKQRVYPDFVHAVITLLDDHTVSMAARGCPTDKDSPVFVNRQESPMTVKTYTERVKSLFYQRFLPALHSTCEQQGTFAENAAFIDAYEAEYPGAHMFRHWFTMYLLTKAGLTSGEIMRWRGDSSQESMNDYIHENADMIRLFRETSYTFQEQILEAIGKEVP